MTSKYTPDRQAVIMALVAADESVRRASTVGRNKVGSRSLSSLDLATQAQEILAALNAQGYFVVEGETVDKARKFDFNERVIARATARREVETVEVEPDTEITGRAAAEATLAQIEINLTPAGQAKFDKAQALVDAGEYPTFGKALAAVEAAE